MVCFMCNIVPIKLWSSHILCLSSFPLLPDSTSVAMMLARIFTLGFILIVLTVSHLIPAILILYGISPYTDIVIVCHYPDCNQTSVSPSTIASLITGAVVTGLLWVAMFYGCRSGVLSRLDQCLWRRSRSYVHPAF
jgi:hypothetical protein